MNLDTFIHNATEIMNTNTSDVNSLRLLRNEINTLQVSQCENPTTLYLRSSDTGYSLPYNVPCGTCYHCVETKLNEWATRMSLETTHNVHCYFITLTYRSYANYADIPTELLNAWWHFDSNNYKGRPCWSPCLIRTDHVSKFMKNLRNDLCRKYDGFTCKFFCGSEYGKNFGRPHHHIILWSDFEITKEDVLCAWSHRVQHGVGTYSDYTPYCDIDSFDYNDLCTNGTIDNSKTATLDSKEYSPKNAFRYVAKYIAKGATKDQNYKRLHLFYEDVFYNGIGQLYDDMFHRTFDDRILKRLYNSLNLFNTNFPHYDYQTFKSLLQNPVNAGFCKKYDSAFASLVFQDVQRVFDYQSTMSRAEGIGLFYAKENIVRLAEGNTSFPSSITDVFGQLVFPSAFARKVQEYRNPYLFGGIATISARKGYRAETSLANPFDLSDTLCKGYRPIILKSLLQLRSIPSIACETFDGVVPVSFESFRDLMAKQAKYLTHSPYAIFDSYSRTYSFIHANTPFMYDECGVPYSSITDFIVSSWRYDRPSRSYVLQGTTSFSEFLCTLSKTFTKSHEQAMMTQKQHMSTFNNLKQVASRMAKFGIDFALEFKQAKERANNQRVSKQKDYNTNHFTHDNE